MDNVSLDVLEGDDSPADKEKPKTGVGIAAAVSINLISGETTSRIADAGHLRAGFVSVQAENDAGLMAATGGLAVALKDSGKTAVALAGAFSYNEITAHTIAEVQDTNLVLTGNAAGDFVLDVNALTRSRIFTLAAGGAGAVASGKSGSQSDGSGSTAVAKRQWGRGEGLYPSEVRLRFPILQSSGSVNLVVITRRISWGVRE